MRMIPPGRRRSPRSSMVPATPPTDPGGTETGCHSDHLVGDVSCSVAVDYHDPIGDAEFFSAEFGLLGEQLAHVDTGAADSVIARPGARHLAGTAAEVEDTGTRLQAQRRAERGE